MIIIMMIIMMIITGRGRDLDPRGVGGRRLEVTLGRGLARAGSSALGTSFIYKRAPEKRATQPEISRPWTLGRAELFLQYVEWACQALGGVGLSSGDSQAEDPLAETLCGNFNTNNNNNNNNNNDNSNNVNDNNNNDIV